MGVHVCGGVVCVGVHVCGGVEGVVCVGVHVCGCVVCMCVEGWRELSTILKQTTALIKCVPSHLSSSTVRFTLVRANTQ